MNITYGNSWVYGFKKMSLIFIVGYVAKNVMAEATPSDLSFIKLGTLISTTPTFSARETWTTNLYTENGSNKSGWITEISPGLNVRNTSGKVKGYLNYSLNLINRSGGENKNALQNSLNSSVNVEVIEGHGFVDTNAFISQQTVSAFALQTNNNNNSSNKTEVSSYSVSPYYRGRLSNILSYEARYSLTTTKAKSLDKFSSNDRLASLKVGGDEVFGKLSWSVGADQQITSRDNAADTEISGLKISLSYPITNKLIFSVSGGRQNQNYTSSEKDSSWTSGAGLNWSVSEMTKLVASLENNPIGKTYSINFEHRTPRTSWRVSDVKNVSLSNNRATPGLGSTYDLLFNQFSSIEPDLIKRAILVNNYLQANGINSNTIAINGYLTSGASLQRTQNISFALLGIRDTVTFTATHSSGKRIETSNAIFDDFNKSSSIRQDGYAITYTHRLTPDTVVSNQFLNQKIYGDVSSQKSELKSVNISASTRVGVKTYVALSARHSRSSSSLSPYRETAVTGNLTVQF